VPAMGQYDGSTTHGPVKLSVSTTQLLFFFYHTHRQLNRQLVQQFRQVLSIWLSARYLIHPLTSKSW
jgi:hypothetical protein